MHLGIWCHGELHQEDLPSDPAGGCGLQPGWKHSVQIPGREPSQPGASPMLCQCVPGVQCSEVGLEPSLCCSLLGVQEGAALCKGQLKMGVSLALSWSDRLTVLDGTLLKEHLKLC